MVRRTVNLPEATDSLVRELALEGESFSAAVTRLVEAGARAVQKGRRPRYVGAAEGPDDLGIHAERYLRELVRSE